MDRIFDAANWSREEDSFSSTFYNQNVKQFWLPEEVALGNDVMSWRTLTDIEKDKYIKVLGGLTLLDTEQGNTGMNRLVQYVPGHQRKAVLSFMQMMENAVHAKSYSNIFQTLATNQQIDDVFEWVKGNELLQKKAQLIVPYYENIKEGDDISLYKALVASSFLEGLLFYSGFFYPLYLAGHGKLTQSGTIIKLIVKDEQIHSVYIGLLAQEIYNEQDEQTQNELMDFVLSLFQELVEVEMAYSEEIYNDLDLTEEVKKFVKYNADRVLVNLGFDSFYKEEDVDAIVLNGISTKTESFDFFSRKSNTYKKASVEPMEDEDFIFDPSNPPRSK